MSSPEMPKSSSGKGVSLCVRYFWASQQRWPSRSRLVVAVSAAWLCLWYCMGGSQPWLIKLQNSVSDTTVRELREELQNLKDKVAIHERRFWLDPLEPLWQYRPKYWLGKTDDVEDKDQVTPYFLGNFVNASDTSIYGRRIYIDLGLHDFGSSVCWMMQHYPAKFDLVYGFESEAIYHSDIHTLASNITECIQGTAAESRGYRTQEVMDTFTFYHNFVGPEDNSNSSPPTRGLSNFIREIGVKDNDFVVMKIDVEGWEYDLLERMMGDGTYKLIDEIFVEVHYNHPDMYKWNWYIFEHTRADVQALLTKARDLGMFIHPWP